MATSLVNKIYVISAVIVNWLSISNYCVLAQNEIGKACTYSKTNQAGVCKLVQECPEAIKAIKLNSISPSDICGYEETSAIVCCVSLNNPPTQPHSLVLTATISQPVVTTVATTEKPTTKKENVSLVTTEPRVITDSPILNVGDKSRTKCQEYEQYVYTYSVAGAPKVDECKAKWSAVPSIIGGVAAKTKEFPHMALIGYVDLNNQTLWLCGGSLISERYILTAGHCLTHATYHDARFARLGDLVLDTDDDDSDPQDFTVEIIKHPRYFQTSKYNDIGLLKLDRNAKLNTYVRPACLDTQPDINLNVYPTTTGWGETDFGKSEASNKALLKVTLEYFTEKECNGSYKNSGVSLRRGITYETQICAGSRNESKDACQGDSGGPLQVLLSKPYCMYSIVGVTSFGKSCGIAQIPGVYTRVYSYLEWIESVVWQ